MKDPDTCGRVHRRSLPTFFLALLTVIITANAVIAATKTETGRYGYYRAPRAEETIRIDGRGEEPCWEKAAWSPIDQLWLGVQPEPEDFSGRFKVLWDEDHLYFLVEIIETSSLTATRTRLKTTTKMTASRFSWMRTTPAGTIRIISMPSPTISL